MIVFGQGVIILCLIFCFAIGALRFYLRIYIARQWSIIEFCSMFALAMELVFGIIQFLQYNGFAAPPTPKNIEVLAKLTFSGTFFYLWSLWGVKISINLLHIQVTRKIPYVHVWAIRCLYLMISTLVLVNVTFLFGCIPVSRKWEGPLGRAKHCPPILAAWDFWLHLALNIFTDILLCILPFPVFICISEPRLRKAIMGIYLLTFLTIVMSLSRAIILTRVDPNKAGRVVEILTMTELATANVIGCLPGISSLFIRKYASHVSRGFRVTESFQIHEFSHVSNQTSPRTPAVASFPPSSQEGHPSPSNGHTLPSRSGSTDKIIDN